MADKKAKEKDPIDIVHQNAIHVETILKEHRCQKLYKNFSINPYILNEKKEISVEVIHFSDWN